MKNPLFVPILSLFLTAGNASADRCVFYGSHEDGGHFPVEVESDYSTHAPEGEVLTLDFVDTKSLLDYDFLLSDAVLVSVSKGYDFYEVEDSTTKRFEDVILRLEAFYTDSRPGSPDEVLLRSIEVRTHNGPRGTDRIRRFHVDRDEACVLRWRTQDLRERARNSEEGGESVESLIDEEKHPCAGKGKDPCKV